jgi:hypothetical protein
MVIPIKGVGNLSVNAALPYRKIRMAAEAPRIRILPADHNNAKAESVRVASGTGNAFLLESPLV